MSQFIKDETTGEDIEVFTEEEIAAREEQVRQDAIDAYKAENPGDADKVAELETALKTAKEDLAKAGDKDVNFKALREAKDTAEKELREFKDNFGKELDERVNTLKSDILTSVQQDHFNETLKALAGGDPDVEKQIKFQYDRIKDPAGTKEEITHKLSDAYLLATGEPNTNALNATVLSSGGVSFSRGGAAKGPLSADEKELGSKFGLSDKDLKQYGATK